MTTIYDALAAKLGRKPTLDETKAEVRRILNEGYRRAAEAGRLAHPSKLAIITRCK